MTEGSELWRDAGGFGLLSTADVAQLSGFSPKTVRRAITDGELAASIVRGEYRVWMDDFRRWIDARRVRPQQGVDAPVRRVTDAGPGSIDRLRSLETGE